ncbi:MAG: hypothetical protein GX490_08655 [Bacilli bacterium]|nr:hypothetical protein [Bacilli bacterium]
MKKKLSKHRINYLLSQLIIFTFVCLIAFVDFFFKYDFHYIRLSIWTITAISVIVYEIVLHVLLRKAIRKAELTPTEEEKKSYVEKYLWFGILLMFDVIVILALLSLYIKSKTIIIILFILGFFIVYIISILIKPLFGINNNNNDEQE